MASGRDTGQAWRSAAGLPGRGAELGVLQDEFTRTAAGKFRCVLITGDPGIGKTRLARESFADRPCVRLLRARARARAHAMCVGDAFGVWAEALDPHFDLLDDLHVVEACGGFLDDLAVLFHRVAAVRGSVPTDLSRPRLIGGLTHLICRPAVRGPVVALLDDAHGADASSWELLRHLSTRPAV